MSLSRADDRYDSPFVGLFLDESWEDAENQGERANPRTSTLVLHQHNISCTID